MRSREGKQRATSCARMLGPPAQQGILARSVVACYYPLRYVRVNMGLCSLSQCPLKPNQGIGPFELFHLVEVFQQVTRGDRGYRYPQGG